MKPNMLKILYTLILFVTLGLASCASKKEESGAVEKVALAEEVTSENIVTLTKEQNELSSIETGKIESRNLTSVIKVNGVVDVELKGVASVSAPMGGYLKSAGLLAGTKVKKGETIAILENPEFINMQQDYLESAGKLEYQQLELERQQKLRDEDVNSSKTLQLAASEYKITKARMDGLEHKLAMVGVDINALKAGKISRTASLRSPINGYIKTSHANIGKYVNPTDVLFELTDKDDLHLELNIYSRDINKIKEGQDVMFAMSNEANPKRKAVISLIGQSTDESGTFSVHCHVDSKSKTDLLPGVYVKAWIETAPKKLPSLPTEAIVNYEASDYVFVMVSDTGNTFSYELIKVKKGVEEEGYVSVTLPESINSKQALVVIKGSHILLAAMKNKEEEE